MSIFRRLNEKARCSGWGSALIYGSNMFEGYNASVEGEKSRGHHLIGVRIGMFLALCVVSLIAMGIVKWSKASLHAKLATHHEQATAIFDPTFMRNGQGANVVYSVGYTFFVGTKEYHNYAESYVMPIRPCGIVFYNPDDPEENELQPITNDPQLRCNE